mmetsp:Transcript_103502/g.270234  ORF Transcript_103502/g.270234 Transcript_103502/m.270234 type:complete len:398 (-) Transcript_103502:893-2086(-)
MSQVAVRTCSAGYGSVPDQVGRGGAQADRDLLALGDRGLPLPLPLVVVAPVLRPQEKGDVGQAALGHLYLPEAAQLAKRGLEAGEAYVELGHGRAVARTGVGHLERDHGLLGLALHLRVPQLELRVRQAVSKRVRGGDALRVVPAVAHEDALGERRGHLVAPLVFALALAWVLRRGEAAFVRRRHGERQATGGARLAGEQLRQGGADLLAGHEHHQHRVRVLGPVGVHGARHRGEHHDRHARAHLAEGPDRLLGVLDVHVGPVPALLRVRHEADHRDVGALGLRRLVREPDLLGISHVLADALEGRHDLVGLDVAAAAPGVRGALPVAGLHRLVAVPAHHGDPLALGLQRQRRVVVLQQHRALDDHLLGDLSVRVAGGVLIDLAEGASLREHAVDLA